MMHFGSYLLKFLKKNYISILSAIILSFLPFTLIFAQISAGINNILGNNKSSRPHRVRIGIIVQSMSTGQILYEHKANDLFTPASVQKLFTAATAFYYLKPDFKFATELFSNGEIKNGVLYGDLTVRFSGDPLLKPNDLDQFFQYLHNTLGVQKIEGRVYIDNFAYNDASYPAGCLWDDLTHTFAAPVNAIILNHNQFSLYLAPAEKIGAPITIKTNLPDGVIYFANRSTTTNAPRRNCGFKINSDYQNVYTVSGCYNQHWGKQGRAMPLRNVVPYAQALIKELIHNNQIEWSGKVEIQMTPPTARLLTTHYSPPLSEIVKKMLKKSDNLYTNTVFKKIGQMYSHRQGSWQNSVNAVKELLAAPTGINFHHALLLDGAGLSRSNLISPRQLSQLLYFIYHNENVKEPLIASLPIAGKDGTLKNRMPSLGHSERVRAKTGTMKTVSALAGYASTLNYGTVSFVIMVNGIPGGRWPYIELQNRICEFLVNAK